MINAWNKQFIVEVRVSIKRWLNGRPSHFHFTKPVSLCKKFGRPCFKMILIWPRTDPPRGKYLLKLYEYNMALPHLGIFFCLCAAGTPVYIRVSWGEEWHPRTPAVEEISRTNSRDSGASSQQQVHTFRPKLLPSLFTHHPVGFFFLFQSCFTLNKRRVSLLHCRYKSSQKEVNWSKLKKPIYLSNKGSKFSDWSATWAGYLISKVSLP